MNRTEIQEFKRFLHVRELFGMFSQYYRTNHLTSNPPTLEAYLEKAKAESVIPLAFVYPKTIYGKDFWLAIHEEWNQLLSEQRADRSEADQLNSLGLEIIEIQTRTNCLGLPKNTCSLSLKGGNRLTLNMEHSKLVAKKLSTHMLLTRSRQTTDVVLMFNRTRGIEVKFKPDSSSLQFNNAELANQLIKLLELDPEKAYFQIGIEVLTETKDYLLFMLKK
ncbi:MAG: hypothetical protein J6T44_11410 [Prevotella sp.]|nr:hypothetical protein [Prevotella sp.]